MMFRFVVYLILAWAAAALLVLWVSVVLAHPRSQDQSQDPNDLWMESPHD